MSDSVPTFVSTTAPAVWIATGQRDHEVAHLRPSAEKKFSRRYRLHMKRGATRCTVVVRKGRNEFLERRRKYREQRLPAVRMFREKGFDTRSVDALAFGRAHFDGFGLSDEQRAALEAQDRAFCKGAEATQALEALWRGNEADRGDGGYEGPDAVEEGDRTINTYLEPGSGDIHVLQRFVAALPKEPVAGPTKDMVRRQYMKRHALYYRYVEADGPLLFIIRIDCDGTFKNERALLGWLEHLYREGRIPFIPHYAVSERTHNGSVKKPHICVLLGVGDGVDPENRKALALFKCLLRAWTRALRPLKADPGGCLNYVRMKNPISPFNKTSIFNQTTFWSMSQMYEFFGSKACAQFEESDWLAYARQCGKDKSSNSPFLACLDAVWREIVPREHERQTPRYLRWMAGRLGMADDLYAEVVDRMIAQFPLSKPKQLMSMTRAVVERCAMTWDPEQTIDRGVMTREGTIVDGMSPKEKRQAAGRRSAGKAREASVLAISKAITALLEGGAVLDTKNHLRTVVVMTGLSRSTVYERWDEAEAAAKNAKKAVQSSCAHQSEPVDRKKAGTDPGKTIKVKTTYHWHPASQYFPPIELPYAASDAVIVCHDGWSPSAAPPE